MGHLSQVALHNVAKVLPIVFQHHCLLADSCCLLASITAVLSMGSVWSGNFLTTVVSHVIRKRFYEKPRPSCAIDTNFLTTCGCDMWMDQVAFDNNNASGKALQ